MLHSPEKRIFYQVKHFLHPKPFSEPFICSIFNQRLSIYLLVPSPELLALHATSCKVVHMTGVAKHVDKVYRDAEQMGMLASDDTSNDILNFKLMSLMVDIQASFVMRITDWCIKGSTGI